MIRMKSKKLSTALIAGALSATIVFSGAGAVACKKSSKIPELKSNYTVKAGTGKVYYVAPNVAPGDGDGTEANPFNIYSVLIDEDSPLSAGDTVLVKPGVYKQDTRIRIENLSGEYNNYITIKNASATEKAVLDFSSMAFDGNNRGVQIDGDYFYWYGIDICGAGDNGMYIGGSYNVIENCEFYDNRDTGLQLGRSYSEYTDIKDWPSYNLIKNCTSYNNYDNQTFGENADGFAAKLTVGYGNIFDGCIAYRNSDDGWDLFAKTDSGNIGAVILYNCVAFENGYLYETQEEFNAKFPTYDGEKYNEDNTTSYLTRDGDGNGFKLGGSVMEGDVYLYNCLSFNNRMHGVTDNSNPGVLSIANVTAFNNGTPIDNDYTSPNFGQIVLEGAGVKSDSKCGNINMSRQEYSYNLMSRVLSVNKDSKTVVADEYRGSAEYSIFDMRNSSAFKVNECIDVSDRAETYAQKGESIAAITADIFEQLPIDWVIGETETTYTYNLSGKKNNQIHKTYRNGDGTVNMNKIFKIKDYSKLFGDDNKIGADLSKGSWDEYKHYSYFNASNADSKDDGAVKSAVATLDLNTNINATYQDFDLLTAMKDVKITWTTSDESVIEINTNTPVSKSGTQDARAIVYRSEQDKNIKLTATVTSTEDTGISMKKEFNIVVKADVPTIGDAIFQGVEDGRIIIDQFSDAEEPAMFVENAADFNGKLLPKSAYTVETSVEYAEQKGGHPVEISRFTTDVAGEYIMYKKVILGNVSRTFSYAIYIASPTAMVDFVGDPAIFVNKNGYSISGEVTSPTGKLYTMTSETQLADVKPEYLMEHGVCEEFRNDKISFQFESDNSKHYYIYYVMYNLYGQPTSTVKEIPVTIENVENVEQFKKILLENNASTIYMLKNDLDLSGETNWVKEITSQKKPFKGLLNGLGHTISGLKVDASNADNELGAMIYKLEGGTIENVKFENIDIKGKEKTGIIATTYGGYLYNIQMHNVHVEGSVRVGGLVGQAMTGDLYVDQISFINDPSYEKVTKEMTQKVFDEEDIFYTLEGSEYVQATEFDQNKTYYIRRYGISGQRTAAIIGFIQAGSALESTRTYISNCYVSACLGKATEQYQGSIVGSADDRNVKDYLEITNCYSSSIVYGRTYVGGILGSHNKGAGVLRVSGCIFTGSLYYGESKITSLTAAEKNCSGIVGRYIATADATVIHCAAPYEDHNSNFDVDGEAIVFGRVRQSSYWTDTLGFSKEKWSFVVDDTDPERIKVPYVTLNFLGEWE